MKSERKATGVVPKANYVRAPARHYRVLLYRLVDPRHPSHYPTRNAHRSGVIFRGSLYYSGQSVTVENLSGEFCPTCGEGCMGFRK